MLYPKIRLQVFILLFLSLFFASLSNDAQAATATVSVGQAVTLSVSAQGTAPFTYQWYKDGSVISGAKSSTYIIGNMAALNVGSYHAVVSNSAGSTTSDQGVLVVVSLISFTTQPASKTATVGSSVTFSAAASGIPAPTYQWRKNGTNISGATSSSYTVSGVTTGSAGTYTVVATNLLGSVTSNGAVLTVSSGSTTSAPVFTTQPSSKTVTSGTSVTFTAATSGSPTPTYQWKKNGTSISGATSASYTIGSATSSSAGTYTVVATNSAGSKTSNGAILTVSSGSTTSAPAFTTQPSSKTVTSGASVTFTAAASGSPTPTYQWKKNGTSISGATSASYTISSTSSSSAGTYTVVASNSAGSVTSSGAVLTIQTASAAMTIWSSASVPKRVDGGADKPVELGVKFRSDVAGTITGIRFYKSTANTGAHIGNLWSSSGTLLASATFSSETSSGWQQVNFSSPVAISANTVYVASYHCNNGHYSADSGYFASAGVDTAPLHALGGSSGNNGLYSYGSSSVFPRETYNSSNYWVDPVFKAAAGSALKAEESEETAIELDGPDFNDDGQPDLVWQNPATGQCVVWLMSGTKVTSKVVVGTFSTDWKLGGVGDINGDGQADLVWWNPDTGACSVWLMDGTKVSSQTTVGTASSTDWEIRAAADFNNDGKADVLWQNNKTGDRTLWMMSGTKIASKVTLDNVDIAWQIGGVGDYNGDGKTDIVWQNILTGYCTIWLMSGTEISSKVSLGAQSKDWDLAGGGDFDGDGQGDIVWQNLKTGECFIWRMSGTKLSSTVSLGTQSTVWVMGN